MTDNPYDSPKTTQYTARSHATVSKEPQSFLAYRGAENWALIWALSFITAQLLWHCSRYFRRYDVLEIPMTLPFNPVAPLFDPHDGMVNSRDAFLYALLYWTCLFGIALLVSGKRINPAVPAAAILLFTCLCSVVYAVFFVFHGPIE